MATRSVSRAGKARSPSRRKPIRPDLADILYRLGEAVSFVTVALQSLDARELKHSSDERAVLATGLGALNRVYRDLDRAEQQLARASRPSP